MPKNRMRGGKITKEDVVAQPLKITLTRSNMQAVVNSLLARGADSDPVLLSVLQELTDEIARLAVIVDPAPEVTGKPPDTGQVGLPIIPINFRYTLTDLNVILVWSIVTPDYQFYEIRKGINWDTADKLLVTNNANAILNPLVYGTHTFLLKALSTLGIYSEDTLRVDIPIPLIGAITIIPTVVTNAVTISWNVPISTFRINYYRVKKDGTQVALAAGTFFATSEEVAGTHVYGITPVDIAGNEGPEATAQVVTTGITDYIFFSRLISTLNGILINGIRFEGTIYVCINANETYENHFLTRNWASPQAQVDAGYAPWLAPFLTTASYEELFDFGVIIHSVIVNINWVYQVIYGNFTFGFEVQTSSDGIAWSNIYTNSSFYATEVRFVKVKINFVGENDLSLMMFKELSVALNVKRENDGGFGTAIASDTNGTFIRFNKATPNVPVFVDVEGITVTPVSDTATFSTFAFNDIPFPTGFTVKVYDNAGVRITRDIRWNARGIV